MFAYIASGLAALVVWDVVFSTHYVLGADWTLASGTLTIALAYIVGQILAAPSGWLIERQFVRRVLFRPSAILMASRELGWRRFLKNTLLQDYYTALDSGLRQKVRERATADRGAEVIDEALFWCAFPVAKRDSNACARLDTFLRLYGFCRNMAFVGIVGAFAIAGDAIVDWYDWGWDATALQKCRWALLTLLIGLGMLHRYLKFFRLYNVEVLVSYSGSPQATQ